ncbi:2247_t:CDS:1 [Cetraspora pellucida]|uniref:2247_t:CDS:1 n=1 Tax=Cetraspora pellucida TaxID=1433469 RepID=A0A9N9J0N0_9GLOM|nr:2247_t:CDS:1 [Cetraspora pellucida]
MTSGSDFKDLEFSLFVFGRQIIMVSRNSGSKSVVEPKIADMGLSGKIDDIAENREVCGKIPYIAPEVLSKLLEDKLGGMKEYTQASDIYSFGMIVWEVISGCRPFSDRRNNEHLILDILSGLRPKIPINTPQDLVELMEICWHSDPKIREKSLGNKNPATGLKIRFENIIRKIEKEEIKFSENRNASVSQTKISEYSNQPLNSLISETLIVRLLN